PTRRSSDLKGIARADQIRRGVLADGAGAADHGVRADAHELMDGRQTAQDGPIAYVDMARELDAVGDDGMAADLAVMRNMHIGHDPVVVAQASHAHVLRRPPIDGDVIAYGVAVADLEPGGFVAVFLVLGNAADGAETIEIVVCTYRGVAVDDTMRAHGGARPDHDVITDDAVWPDAYIAGDPGPGGNDRR